MYNKAHFRYLTTQWVSTCFCLFAIIEDAPLVAMFKMLYAQVEVPSADTASRDVKETFRIAQGASVAGSGQVRFFDPPRVEPRTATEPDHLPVRSQAP